MIWPLLLLQSVPVFPPPAAPPRTTAVRTPTPLVVDGKLDEAAWQSAPVAGGWRQVDPDQGAAATVGTDARITFDDRHIYVAFVARDSAGAPAPSVRNLRRDFRFDENDVVAVVFDPFDDQRTGFLFQVTAAGNQRDALFLNGQGLDQDWDVPWRARTAVTDSGWTAELAIPWSALRYPDGPRSWRVNFYRGLRRRDEVSSWSPVPRAIPPMRTDYAGIVDGLEPPRAASPVQLQPYLLAQSGRLRASGGNRTTQAIGGEVKWQPSASTVVDVTVNTDFAQAEVDRQVVNLSRFSPFFPERRPFFLENRALFSTGVEGRLQPFFSRRVGLGSDGVPVPLEFGGRVIRRTATSSSGVLVVRQGASEALASSEIGVARSTRNLGERSRVGAMLVGRHDRRVGDAAQWHGTMALDGFSQLTPTLALDGSLAATRRSTVGGDGLAGHVSLQQSTSSLMGGMSVEFVDDGFAPEAGFIARQNYVEMSGGGILDLRPRWLPRGVRSYQPNLDVSVIRTASRFDFLEAQVRVSPLSFRSQTAASADIGLEVNWQQLDEPFQLVPGATTSAGSTVFPRVTAGLASNPAAEVSWGVDGGLGGYFNGRLASLDGRFNWTPDPRIAIAARYSANRLSGFDSLAAAVTTHLLVPELRLALNPRVQLATFYQFNTAARRGSMNLRFAWELAPLSFLYVIWNGERAVQGLPAVRRPVGGDQISVKFAYLLRR